MLKGLIIKDFINLKKNFKIFGLLTILYAVMAFATDDSSFFSSIITMLFAILTLTLYSYDDMAKWDIFALTMPVTKDNIVQGKYIMMLLLTAIGAAYSTVFTVLINITLKTSSLFHSLEIIGAGAAIVILMYSIIIPFITKLGVEKARLILFAVYAIPFVTIMAFNRMLGDGSLVVPDQLLRLFYIFMDYVYIILPILVMVVLTISYHISIRLYRKKEF